MIRRDFLNTTVKSALACAIGAGCRKTLSGCANDDILQDRLWMWGHDSGVYDGPKGEYNTGAFTGPKGIYNIPLSPPISMADSIKYMGIPNVCVIRHEVGNPEYNKQFHDVKRIAWSLAMGSKDSYQHLKQYVFGLRDTTPNLTGYYLDDFFRFNDKPGFNKNSEIVPAPATLSLDEIKQLHDETLAYKRRLNLAIVLYTHMLCPAIKPYMKYIDTVSLWIWTGKDIGQIEENFKKYRSLLPDKPTLLGIYMWDFGGKKELDVSFMVNQLDYALRLYKEGQIDGMIFHCTPLCNKGLAAVEYAKTWIAEHGGTKR